MVNLPEIQTEEIHIRWEVGVYTQDAVSVCNLWQRSKGENDSRQIILFSNR